MSQRAVKWGQLRRYLLRNGFQIVGSGGDKIITRDNQIVRVGHTSSSSPGSQVLDCYLSALCRKFGITREAILE